MHDTQPRAHARQRSSAGATLAQPPSKVLLLGGGSEIGLAILAALPLTADTEVLLAGRDEAKVAAAAAALPPETSPAGRLPGKIRIMHYDATEPDSQQAVIAAAFESGPVDLVISAAGVLTDQAELDTNSRLAGAMIETNFTSHVTTLLEVAGRMRARGRGTIVILSSIAAVRPRKANYVYGAAKAGLDAFARGLADTLHGTGVRVLLVRPGFVIGRMTEGMDPAPLATTPAKVAAAVATALAGNASVVWVPPPLRLLAAVLLAVPRPLWRRLRR